MTQMLMTIVAALLVITTPAQARSNVAGYYNELRQVIGFKLRYPLWRQDGRWFTKNRSWNKPIPATVDLRNGYVFFSDEGTGGGNFETQIVLWRRPDGSPLIGIAESGYDPPYPDRAKVRFFVKDNEKWQEATGYVWPALSLSDFLTADMTIQDLRAVQAIGSSIYYVLPRRGTTVIAYVVVKDTYVQAACKGEDWFRPGNRSAYLHFCDRLGGRIFTRIDLVWNKREGRFTKGSKSRASVFPWSPKQKQVAVEWQAQISRNPAMVGLQGTSRDGQVTLSGGCNKLLGPGFSGSLYNYRGDALQRSDDKSEPVIFEIVSAQERRSFYGKMHYFAPEKTWVTTENLPFAFLRAMASGEMLTIRNGKGETVTTFGLTGAEKAVETMRHVCQE